MVIIKKNEKVIFYGNKNLKKKVHKKTVYFSRN